MRRIVLAPLFLLMLLTACGGDEQTLKETPGETDAPTTVASATKAKSSPTPATPSAAPTAAPPTVGTRDNPAPIGSVLDTGDGWHIQVLAVTPDALSAIMAENQFNDPPKAGTQFFMATVQATRTATDPDTFDGGYALRAVGPSSVSYSTFDNYCGVVPDDIPSSEVFQGGVLQGNVC